MLSKLIKKHSTLSSTSRAAMVQAAENRHTMGLSQQEASGTAMHKGNTGYLKSTADQAHSSQRATYSRKSWLLGSESTALPKPWAQPIIDSAKVCYFSRSVGLKVLADQSSS